MDPNQVASWRDLFVGMLAAGASLTGLTFVAIALDPHQIERTPLLRTRAAGAVLCFVSVMFLGTTVLTPRPFGAASALIVGLGGLGEATYLIARFVRQRSGANPLRAAGAIVGFGLAGIGGLLLAAAVNDWALYTLAAACVVLLVTGVYASWLLVLQIGVPPRETRAARPEE
jgi:hypothetical protein